MTLVGYSVLVALPAINSAWVDQLGFTEVQVNRVASADLLGLFLGAVATSVLIKRVSRQALTYPGYCAGDSRECTVHPVCRL